MIVHVDSQTNTNSWAKSGPQFRASLTAGSPDYGVYLTPAGVVSFQYRDNASQGASEVAEATPAATPRSPLVRTGLVYTASYATVTGTPAATDWITLGSHTASTVPISDYMGLAVCSHNTAQLNITQFSQLTLTGNAPIPPPVSAPAPGYVDADIGAVSVAGATNATSTTITESGSGADIWNQADQFHYYYQPQTTDVTIITHVDSTQATNPWAKVGPMFRDSTAAGAICVGVYEIPPCRWKCSGATRRTPLPAAGARLATRSTPSG